LNTFNGFPRLDGSVGVRNDVVVLPTVSCANGVVAAIARQAPEIVSLYHSHGCGRKGSDLEIHTRTLGNLCCNPNIAAVLIISLGCESLQPDALIEYLEKNGKPHALLTIQEEGGSQKTAAKGAEICYDFLQKAAKIERRPVPLDHLMVGLECGGSDAFSGVTANPAVGSLSDWLVEQGCSVILTETTELIGTSHILMRRAKNEQVAERIKTIITAADRRNQLTMGDGAAFAITPGNMAGGMTTIREKSLGCVVKGGTTRVNQVVEYAEIPSEKGLVIMDGPGYDTDSLAGLAASGAQIILFSTGRGNPIGFPFVPVIKIATTTHLFAQMQDDMDLNAGTILEGESIASVGERMRAVLLQTIEGTPTKAEMNRQDGILCLYTLNAPF
jgi:altronate dehydratase large subunit